MKYHTVELKEIPRNTLQFLIDWSISGIKDKKYSFDKLFRVLLSEKLRRNEEEM